MINAVRVRVYEEIYACCFAAHPSKFFHFNSLASAAAYYLQSYRATEPYGICTTKQTAAAIITAAANIIPNSVLILLHSVSRLILISCSIFTRGAYAYFLACNRTFVYWCTVCLRFECYSVWFQPKYRLVTILELWHSIREPTVYWKFWK